MNLRFVNKLIIDHLRWSGYLLEARILEREFKAKKPNPQSEASKLMNIIENGLQNTGESSASIIPKLFDENHDLDARISHQASIVTKNDTSRTSEQFEPQSKSRGRSLGSKYTGTKDAYVTRNSGYQRSESDYNQNQPIAHTSNITNIAKILREQKRSSSIQNQPEAVYRQDHNNESLNNSYSYPPVERFPEKQRLPTQSTPNGYIEILPKNYIDDVRGEERGNNYQHIFSQEDQTPHSVLNHNTWDGHSNTSTMLPTRQNSKNTSFLQNNHSKNSYYLDSNFIKKSANNKRQSFASASAQSEQTSDYHNLQRVQQKTSESEVWNNNNNHSLSYGHHSHNSSFISQKPQKSSLSQNYTAFLADSQRRSEAVPPSTNFKPPSHKSLIDGFISSEKKDTLPLLKEKKNVKISPFEAEAEVEPENKNIFKHEPFISMQPKEMGNFKRVYEPIAYAPRTKIDKSQSFTAYSNDQSFSKNVQRQFSNPNPNPQSLKLGFTKEQSPFGRSIEASGGFHEALKNPVQAKGYQDYTAPTEAQGQVGSKIDAKILEHLVSSTSFNETEVKAYFKVYESLVPNKKNPMDKNKFRDFANRIRNVNGDHFYECLFDNGHELGFVRDSKFIEFKDAVVILDRLNQDNPFSIMNFVFKIAGQENPSISLIETILRDVRPANTKGRISILLDSLEFIYAQTKLQRADSLKFEQYLQIIKNFEPIRKYC